MEPQEVVEHYARSRGYRANNNTIRQIYSNKLDRNSYFKLDVGRFVQYIEVRPNRVLVITEVMEYLTFSDEEK
jgi:hypothetical protein